MKFEMLIGCLNRGKEERPGCTNLKFRKEVAVQSLSRVWLFVTPWTAARQASPSFTTPGVYSNSCPLTWWCHPTISSSVSPFSSCPQSFPASWCFPVNQLFAAGPSIGASASASVLPLNIQDWFPLGLTSLLSLLSRGLSRVFSSTTVLKHQLFSAQACLWSSLTSIHDYWENHGFDYMDLCWQSDVSAFSGKWYTLEMGVWGSLAYKSHVKAVRQGEKWDCNENE